MKKHETINYCNSQILIHIVEVNISLHTQTCDEIEKQNVIILLFLLYINDLIAIFDIMIYIYNNNNNNNMYYINIISISTIPIVLLSLLMNDIGPYSMCMCNHKNVQ